MFEKFQKTKLEHSLLNSLQCKHGFNYNVYILKTELNICFATRKNIYISENKYNQLDIFQLIGLIFHEIGHIELKHHIKSYIFNILIILLNICTIFFQINLIFQILVVISSILIFVGFNHIQEHEADRFSAIHSNKLYVISLLQYYKNKSSFTHPHYLQRINVLKNYLKIV